jgi:hypothetical protein
MTLWCDGHVDCVYLSDLPVEYSSIHQDLFMDWLPSPCPPPRLQGLCVAWLHTVCCLQLTFWAGEWRTNYTVWGNKWLTHPQRTKGSLGADIHLTIQWSFKEFMFKDLKRRKLQDKFSLVVLNCWNFPWKNMSSLKFITGRKLFRSPSLLHFINYNNVYRQEVL